MQQRWAILAVLTFARTAMGFQFQSVASLAPFVESSLGLDKAQLGWLIGIYLLPGIVFALPGGVLGARYGDKRLALIGLAAMGAGGLWLPYAATPFEADVARCVAGAGAVILNVLLTKMVADWFEGRERVLAMAILVNAWPIGIGLALLALGPLAASLGWQTALGATTAFAALAFVVVLAAYRAPSGSPAAGNIGFGLGLLSASEWRLLAIGSLPWMLYNAAFQISISFLPSYLVEHGFTLAQAGVASAVNTVTFMIAVQLGGVLLKRARRPDLACHFAALGWGLTLLGLATGTAPLAWIAVGGLIGGLPAGGYVSLPAEFLRAQTRSAGMGVFYTIYYVGCATLPAAAGALYDAHGAARPTLWLAAAFALACIPALGLYRLVRRHSAA